MPRRRQNKRGKRAANAQPNRLAALERAIARLSVQAPVARAGPKRLIPPSKPVVARGGHTPDSSVTYAAGLLRQLLDPCHSPQLPWGDSYTGKGEFIDSCTTFTIYSGSGGQTGFCVNPVPTGLLQSTATGGGAWVALTTSTNDSNLAGLITSDSKYLRCVGLCVKVQKTSAYDTANAAGYFVCASVDNTIGSVSASAAAYKTWLLQQGASMFDPSVGLEFSWCPSRAIDFVPCVPSAEMDTSVDIEENVLYRRPRLLFFTELGTVANTQFMITINARWESFLLPTKHARGSMHSRQDTRAIDMVMSGLHDAKFASIGEAAIDTAPQRAAALEQRIIVSNPPNAIGSILNGIGAAVGKVGTRLADKYLLEPIGLSSRDFK